MSSLHDNEDRVVLHVGIGTYHRLLYEAMKRRRTPNQVTDELVNEALDRVAEEIEVENKAATAALEAARIEAPPAFVPPPPRVEPAICPHGRPVGSCRETAACYEQLTNKQGMPPANGPICDVTKGTRCRNPLYWRGRARCGCSRPSRSAA